MLDFVIWNLDPDIINFGFPRIRYYGVMFIFAFFAGHYIMDKIYKRENQSEESLEKLLWYMMGATIIGARLGHCLFYQPEYYLANPLEILKVWEGGLASHGGGVAIILALFYYSKKVVKKHPIWIFDRIVIVVALAGFFIRMGNFANSEIYGKATHSSSGFVFARDSHLGLYAANSEEFKNYVKDIEYTKRSGQPIMDGKAYPITISVFFKPNVGDEATILSYTKFRILNLLPYDISDEGSESNIFIDKNQIEPATLAIEKGKYVAKIEAYAIPKQPTNIYEAVSYLLLFVLLGFLFIKGGYAKPGLISGLFFTILFASRFLLEYLKENQVAKEMEMTLNMGQKLSIPFIIGGIILLIISLSGVSKNWSDVKKA